MKSTVFARVLGALTFVGAVFVATASQAAIIASGPGSGTCVMADSSPCVVTAITPHAAWQPNNPFGSGAVWVSYAPTGFGDAVFQPHDHFDPIFSITETIVVGVNNLLVDFTVWADDTVDVIVDGVLLFAANFSQSTCAGGVIGCEPGEGGHFAVVLTPGVHTITFVAYQIGTGTDTSSNPFGMIYAGTTTEIPEPGTLALLGVGALMIGFGARRSRRKNA
jgi:hypothetical protein